MSTFTFYSKLEMTLILGRKARNVGELLEGIRHVPDSSIYHHTHRYLQQHHHISPEPPNDFAFWVTTVLVDRALGEQLSSVDTIQFAGIADLRERFVEILETSLAGKEVRGSCPPGEEFYFLASRSFSFPTPHVAKDPAEFAETLKKVTISSIYYHVFDSRIRLAKGENDFSRWFRDLGMPRLADQLQRLDPYSYTTEGLRNRIIKLVKSHDTH
jgi:hypothetical protein